MCLVVTQLIPSAHSLHTDQDSGFDKALIRKYHTLRTGMIVHTAAILGLDLIDAVGDLFPMRNSSKANDAIMSVLHTYPDRFEVDQSTGMVKLMSLYESLLD